MLIKAMKITEQDIFDDFWDQNIFGGVEYIDVKVKRVVEAIFIAGSLLDNVLMFAECFFLQSSWRYTNMINPIFHENIKKVNSVESAPKSHLHHVSSELLQIWTARDESWFEK